MQANSKFKIQNSEFDYDSEIIDGIEYLIIANSSDIFEGKGKQFLFGEDKEMQLAVFRIDKKLFCLSNICPHRHQDQIHNGIIDNMNVICPVHGWTYSLESGLNVNPQQGVRSLKSYKIFEKENKVFIEKPLFEIPKWKI